MSFFGKLRHKARLYMWYSKESVFVFKNEELVASKDLLHIYDENLQGGLNNSQPPLMEVIISIEQTTFLPLWLIVDDIVLVQEMLH